jgi:hypothetical protein
MRAKVLYAAEKRGLRIQNTSPKSFTDTLSNFKAKISRSNAMTRKASDQKVRFTNSSQELPDFLNKFTLARGKMYDPDSKTTILMEQNIDMRKNIRINYSPSHIHHHMPNKSSTRTRIVKTKLKVDRAISSFVPDITFGDRKFR